MFKENFSLDLFYIANILRLTLLIISKILLFQLHSTKLSMQRKPCRQVLYSKCLYLLERSPLKAFCSLHSSEVLALISWKIKRADILAEALFWPQVHHLDPTIYAFSMALTLKGVANEMPFKRLCCLLRSG